MQHNTCYMLQIRAMVLLGVSVAKAEARQGAEEDLGEPEYSHQARR